MAFEPLQTDEKLDAPVEKAPDMDAAMLTGCSGFVFASVGGYILSVWPFLVFPDSEKLIRLATASGIGFVPASILGIIATRKFGLAGACGFVGAALATGIFLYLRLDEIFIGALARQAPTPDYPKMMSWLLPLAWILATAIIAIAVLPKEKDEV